MLRNYIKTALRNLLRQKSSSLINISGLTLGITCSLVLFLMIRHLSSFDNYHSKRNRIYRVVNQSDGNQGKNYTSGVPSVLPDAFDQHLGVDRFAAFGRVPDEVDLRHNGRISKLKAFREIIK